MSKKNSPVKSSIKTRIFSMGKKLDTQVARLAITGAIVLAATGAYALTNKTQHVSLQPRTAPVAVPVTTQVVAPLPVITEAAVITVINQQRFAKGLPPLAQNAQLDSAALARAQDMITNHYNDNSSHNPWGFVDNVGYHYNHIWLLSNLDTKTSTQAALEMTSLNGSTLLSSGNDIGMGIVSTGAGSYAVVIYTGVLTPTSTSTTSYPALTTGTNCSQVQATFGPIYLSGLSVAASTWSSTSTQMNDGYDQEVQTFYNSYVSEMQQFSCPPQSQSPTLRYLTTQPIQVAHTCDTTIEAQYENTYQSQMQQAHITANQQFQSLMAQLNAVGAGTSSAVQQGQAAINQQLNIKLGQLTQTFNSQLLSIYCPTQ